MSDGSLQETEKTPEEMACEIFHAGGAIDRALAQRAIGVEQNIAWWDEVATPGIDSSALDVGEMIKADRSAIDADAWAFHCRDRDHGGHGLQLASEPAVIALVKRPSGNVVALIGYRAAS